jgi:hypothetical protein
MPSQEVEGGTPSRDPGEDEISTAPSVAKLLGIELGQPDLRLQRRGGCGRREQEEMRTNTWEQIHPTRKRIERCNTQINLESRQQRGTSSTRGVEILEGAVLFYLTIPCQRRQTIKAKIITIKIY